VSNCTLASRTSIERREATLTRARLTFHTCRVRRSRSVRIAGTLRCGDRPAARAPEMLKKALVLMAAFEFRCVRVTQDRVVESEGQALVDALNELGRDGWQLASLCAEQGHEGTYLALLQRTMPT